MFDFIEDIEINGFELKVLVEVDGVTQTYEYGADADGNRGTEVTDVLKMTMRVYDHRGYDITEKLKKRYKKEYRDLRDKAEEILLQSYN